MINLLINGKQLCEIFEPLTDFSQMTTAEIVRYSLEHQMYPSEVHLTAETYSRDAERTADYELEYLVLINRKSKPEFTWNLIKKEYVEKLLAFLNYNYNFKNGEGIVIPREADEIIVQYQDFTGSRSIVSYLGQTIEGTLVEYEGVQYWENFRISFPER